MTWSSETNDDLTAIFGPPTCKFILKAEKEFEELKEAITQGQSPEKIALECADVVICLVGVCAFYGRDLALCVIAKMLINKGRKWKQQEDGTWQHV